MSVSSSSTTCTAASSAAGGTAVDPGVVRDQVGLVDRVRALVLGHQPPARGSGPSSSSSPSTSSSPASVVVRGLALVVLVLAVQLGEDVRLLLGQQLVQGLALLLLGRRVEPNRIPADQRSAGMMPASSGSSPGLPSSVSDASSSPSSWKSSCRRSSGS